MYLSTKRALLLIGIIFSLTTFPGTLFAAGFDLVKFTTTPKTPGANESVLVLMNSFAVNLSTANITWYVNKEPIKNGMAEKSITVRTGDFGEQPIIDVIILTAEGQTLNKQLVIAPAEVDILWEAQTYTPPFYKGKALPSYKSMVRVTAIPRFNTLTSNPAEYYYKWTYDRIKGAGEAIGRNSIVIPVGYAGSSVPVDVETSLPGTEWKGAKYVAIPVSDPKVTLYEQAPLLGTLFHHALKQSTETTGTEFTVRAVPYFFSLDGLLNGELSYKWNVGNQYRQSEVDAQNLTLVRSGKNLESQTISLDVQNPKRILQHARVQGVISFTSQE